MARTWGNLIEITQKILADNGAELWYEVDIRNQLVRANLLLTIHRAIAGAERTATLTTTPNVAIYKIHSVHNGRFEQLIWPLRATVGGIPIIKTTFAAISRLHPDWREDRGTPETFFMIGANMFGFHPAPTAATDIALTYLMSPPVEPDDDAALKINAEWHDILPLYAAAVLLAAEGKTEEGAAYIQQFMTIVGLPRDERFLRGAEQQVEQSTQFGPKQASE